MESWRYRRNQEPKGSPIDAVSLSALMEKGQNIEVMSKKRKIEPRTKTASGGGCRAEDLSSGSKYSYFKDYRMSPRFMVCLIASAWGWH